MLGDHYHVCPQCDAVWHHKGIKVRDNDKAHTCPKCGCKDQDCFKWKYQKEVDNSKIVAHDWNGDLQVA